MELNKEQIEFLNGFTRREWTINKKTGLVDIKGDFNCSNKGLTDFKGVKFGVVTGDFYCHYNNLTSLEGAPQVVDGTFNCHHNKLTSLEGAPQKVGGHFDCSNNKLTSLEGAPRKVGNYFSCDHNKLTSLVGAPQVVGENFYCHYNNLTSLEGAPQKVGDFYCHNNKLTSLEGAPQVIRGILSCSNNPISEKTLKLVWNTMKKNKIDYWMALLILKSQIPNGYWKRMSRGLDEILTKDTQKGVSMLGRFGHFD